LQIRYCNTLNHLVALQKYLLRNTSFGRKMMLHRFIAVEAVIVFISIFFAINHNRINVLIGFATVSGLAWLFRRRSVLLQFKKDFKRERRKDKSGSFEKERVLSITPDELCISVDANQTCHTWDEVETTDRDREHIYIILKGVLHYVIPVTAFADDQEVDEFATALDTYRSAT